MKISFSNFLKFNLLLLWIISRNIYLEISTIYNHIYHKFRLKLEFLVNDLIDYQPRWTKLLNIWTFSLDCDGACHLTPYQFHTMVQIERTALWEGRTQENTFAHKKEEVSNGIRYILYGIISSWLISKIEPTI